ncbi:MAG: isochorismatase family protein [Betaproteobacteria bacterium]|jgi:nicotinamidase-related amidase|nr:isochorismatase family protein [Betaproteobacteria bacterium]
MNPESLWSDVIDAPTAALMAGRKMAPFSGRRLAVVAVDLYDLVYDGGPKPVPELIESYPASCGEFAWRALPPTMELFSCARENGVPVVHVTYDTRLETDPRRIHPTNRKRRQPDLSLYTIKKELTPQPGELVIYKKRASAFFGTPLAAFLNELRVDALIMVGESTSGCVRSSVVEGWSHGYPVAVVADCVFDRCDLIQKASLFDMHLKYAEVMDVAAACGHIHASASGRH